MRQSDQAMCRIAVFDCCDRVMTMRPDQAEFAEYLRDRVFERIASGRSMDSDEWRALSALDKA